MNKLSDSLKVPDEVANGDNSLAFAEKLEIVTNSAAQVRGQLTEMYKGKGNQPFITVFKLCSIEGLYVVKSRNVAEFGRDEMMH